MTSMKRTFQKRFKSISICKMLRTWLKSVGLISEVLKRPNNKLSKQFCYRQNTLRYLMNGYVQGRVFCFMAHLAQVKLCLANASPNNVKWGSSVWKDHNFWTCTWEKVKKMLDKFFKEPNKANPALFSWTNWML